MLVYRTATKARTKIKFTASHQVIGGLLIVHEWAHKSKELTASNIIHTHTPFPLPSNLDTCSLIHSFTAPSTLMPMKSHSWVKVLHVRSCERQAVLGKAVEGTESVVVYWPSSSRRNWKTDEKSLLA